MNGVDPVGLVCPECRGTLDGDGPDRTCRSCGASWPGRDGFPCLYREATVGRRDRFMRLFYDGLPSLHDPLTTHVLPRLQGGGSERQIRDGALDALELQDLPTDRPVRLLEVGVGAGANLPLLAERLAGRPAEVHGVDLSLGMLRECRKRVPIAGMDVTLALADAHRLPYADGTFDRVLHVGAAGSWTRPAVALAELARVAKPDTPVVVVDEQLDRASGPSLAVRLAFRLLTFHDRQPHAPVEHVPAGAHDVRVRQVSRFYYALSFRPPTRRTAAP